MNELPITVDDKPPNPMSVMKEHFLSQFIRLLPHGIIDEDKMTLVGTGGFARVYVAEVGHHLWLLELALMLADSISLYNVVDNFCCM